MSDFEYIKNDMPKIGHIKNYIIKHKEKHRIPEKLGFAVLFTPVRFNYWGGREWSW
jgi:hypothetical protein